MADEILKAKLQQIDANDTQIGSNDEQIGTNDREIKGQVNALKQYGMGVTGIQRDRLGDVVYDLADGYGQGGGAYPIEIKRVTLQSAPTDVAALFSQILPEYPNKLNDKTSYIVVWDGLFESAPEYNRIGVFAVVGYEIIQGAAAKRFRSGTWSTIGVFSSYEAFCQVGDTYTIYQFALMED